MKKTLLLTTALTLGLLVTGQAAYADEETELLKKEIKALEARINQLEKREQAHKKEETAVSKLAPSAGASTNAAYAAPARNIDQRLAIVERNQEVTDEKAKAKALTDPKIDIGAGKGFTIATADRQYSINIRAYAQIDNRTFLDSGATGATNTFLVRTARPIFEAKMTDYFNARMMWDFGQGNSRLLDAYGDFHPLPGNDIINFRAGEFKVPLGIERWQSEQDILFTERGMTTNLVPFRDIGAMVYGQLIPDQLEYHVGIVNGSSDLQVNTGDTDNNKDVAGRIFAHPLVWSGVHALEGIGLGVAGSYGLHQGTTAVPQLTSGYVTPGQRVFFAYVPAAGTVFANGAEERINPQLMYYNGPVGVLGEYVHETQELSKGAVTKTLANDAWLASASYVLTGEDASYDGVKPVRAFNPAAGDWGAFELVGRYSQLDIDKDTFPIFANIATQSRKAQEFTGGGTWYFNPMVKLNLDYSFTSFNGGRAGGLDREDERVLMTRAQFRF